MASTFYGLNNTDPSQQLPDAVTVGTSTGSTDIEVRVDQTKKWSQVKLRQALDALYHRMVDGRFTDSALWTIPPA